MPNSSAIRGLHHAYADVVNRRAWDELAELILPGAPIMIDTRVGEPLELTGPDGLAAFVGPALEPYAFFEFIITSARILPSEFGRADEARARLYMQEARVDHDGIWSTAYGLYEDGYREIDGRWWIATRRYSSLARTAPDGGFTTFPFPRS